MRARFVDHFAPYVRDAVFAGADRDDIAALIFPDVEACRKLGGLGSDAPPSAIIEAPAVRAKFAELLTKLAAASPRSLTRVERMLLMADPPSMDKGEMTDKGSINQRAVLKNRDALVDELYAVPLSSRVIAAEGKHYDGDQGTGSNRHRRRIRPGRSDCARTGCSGCQSCNRRCQRKGSR